MCIVDPFCGKGSVLAVANYVGMDAIGGTSLRKEREKERKEGAKE
jgi:tRNA G10  N-methylase Trm11